MENSRDRPPGGKSAVRCMFSRNLSVPDFVRRFFVSCAQISSQCSLSSLMLICRTGKRGRFQFINCPHLERSCPNAADIVRCRRTGSCRKPVDNAKMKKGLLSSVRTLRDISLVRKPFTPLATDSWPEISSALSRLSHSLPNSLRHKINHLIIHSRINSNPESIP